MVRCANAAFLRAGLAAWVLAAGLSFLPGRPASAQPGGPEENYRIAPGDVLRIDIGARPDLSGQFVVDSRGTVTLPALGPIRASGRTAAELSSDLSRRYSLIDRTITRVDVRVSEARSNRIYVLGSVLVPGTYTFAEPPTIWEAIALAGGPTEDALLSAVEVIPAIVTGEHRVTTVDVAAAIREERLGSLPRLKPGDTIRVPRNVAAVGGDAGPTVYVMGAVLAQGALPHGMAPDLVTALMRAGGATPDADLKRIEIVRTSGVAVTRFKVNLREYYENASLTGNPDLEPGDRIYLQRSQKAFGFFSTLGLVTTLLGIASTVAVLTR